MSHPIESTITITCSKRITPYLEREVEMLGYTIFDKNINSVSINGTMADAMKLNFYVRTGNQVLYKIAEFNVAEPKALFKKMLDIQWDTWLKEDGYFSIVSTGNNENIDNFMYVNQVCKDAIADFFMGKYGQRPDSGPEKNKAVISIYWVDDVCTVYLDTSGETLTKHNYRKVPFKAPMQEALAAATILATGWDMDSNFVNPMCGSGTLAIEAALMVQNKYPGLLRNYYAFMHFKVYEEDDWEAIRKEAKSIIKKDIQAKIIASDRDPLAIDVAKRNAQTAGVDHLIHFEVCDFENTTIPEGAGVVFINPEYGHRLGDLDILEEVYIGIGDFFKKSCAGYLGCVFTGNLDLGKKIGLKPKRKTEFYNGKIDCRLFQFELYKGSKTIKV